MVRTKGDGGAARTVASKAPRKALGGGGGSAAAASRAIAGAAAGAFASPGGKYGGGNSYNAQPTPGWQKKLTNFFQRDPNAPPPKEKNKEEGEGKEDNVEKVEKDKGNFFAHIIQVERCNLLQRLSLSSSCGRLGLASGQSNLAFGQSKMAACQSKLTSGQSKLG